MNFWRLGASPCQHHDKASLTSIPHPASLEAVAGEGGDCSCMQLMPVALSCCINRCWYCNYSVDRMEHLYHHMRQVHPQELQEMGRMQTVQTDDSRPSSPDSSNHDEAQEDEVIQVSEESEAAVPASPSKPKTMQPVGQATYKGVPVEVVAVDGERRFRCLQCDFLSADLPATARHVQQHQAACPRYPACHNPLGGG